MAQLPQISTFEKLLKTRYPLTNYLYRQQQFLNVHPTAPSSNLTSNTESTIVAVQKRKTPLPPPRCFNVPDTLDFNASEYEQNDQMEQDSEITDEIVALEFDETLLKSIDNRISGNHSENIFGKNLSFIQRSSAIQLEFSPYEQNSPLQKAIENGLNIINK